MARNCGRLLAVWVVTCVLISAGVAFGQTGIPVGVTGPGSSSDDDPACFDGVTGRRLKVCSGGGGGGGHSNGANCSAGSYPLGVNASGVVEDCTDATTEIDSAIATHDAITDAHHTATVDTSAETECSGSESLRGDGSCTVPSGGFTPDTDPAVDHSSYVAGHANGADCAAGSYPLGVDASGAVVNCTDATTEINGVIVAHAAIADSHHTATTDTGPTIDCASTQLQAADGSCPTQATVGNAATSWEPVDANIVTNAGTSDDNEIPRFDSTTGKIIQDGSGVTISDLGVISGPSTGSIDFDAGSSGQVFVLKEATGNGDHTYTKSANDDLTASVTCDQNADGSWTGDGCEGQQPGSNGDYLKAVISTNTYASAETNAVRWNNAATTTIGTSISAASLNIIEFDEVGDYRVKVDMSFEFSAGAATDCVGLQMWQPSDASGANDYVGPIVPRDNDTATMTADEITAPYEYTLSITASGQRAQFYTILCEQVGSTYPSSAEITQDRSVTIEIWKVD